MSPDQVHQGIILVGGAAFVFLGVYSLALEGEQISPLRVALVATAILVASSWAITGEPISPLRLLACLVVIRFVLIAISFCRQFHQREESWVERANRELGKISLPPRKFGTLEGWSWQPLLRDPNMTVRVQDRSADGKRLQGYIIGTPGTLQVACKARTWLRLLDGWITLTCDGDPPITLRAGDEFVVEPGFRGQWENETFTHLNFGLVLP